MHRRAFLEVCQLLGLAAPMFTACSSGSRVRDGSFSGSVLIIGAGAAGLTAGHLLRQQGIAFQILEAGPSYGGRMKRTTEFADFPIPLGAEWIHVDPDILNEIVNDDSVVVDTETTRYDPETDVGLFNGELISLEAVGFAEDSKFVNATWFDFFKDYIAQPLETHITYNTVVEAINYSADTIQVNTAFETFTADRVIVTVPVKLLQNNAITFTPALPQDKQEAINRANVWDGCKAFIEFSEKFYPTFVEFSISPPTAGQKLYYDAAYAQPSSRHVLGFFAVGTGSLPYTDLSESARIEYMLNELDDLFDGQASRHYVQQIFQNWNAEPFAKGAYVSDNEDWRVLQQLGESVDARLLFAGDAYTQGDDWSSVHTAVRSAKRAVAHILNSG